jgi:hypothetical protein
LKLQAQPRIVPLMQFTRLNRSGPINATNSGLSKDHMPMQGTSKITTFPAKGSNPTIDAGNHGKEPGKAANLPAKEAHPIQVKEKHERTFAPRRFGSRSGGDSSPHLASSPSRNSFNSMSGGGGHGGGGGGGGGGRH